MRIKLFLVLFLSLLLFNLANAYEEKKVVRVAISNQNFSNFEHSNVKFVSDDIIKIIDLAQSGQIPQLEEVKSGNIIEISMIDEVFNISIDGKIKYEKLIGPLLISSNSDIGIVELNRKGTPAKYKGLIELRVSKNNPLKFNIINIIDMQNYLRGVVPNEMPISFGLEALKAQSVAARNYATNANMNPNYDLVDSTAAQVYYGVNSYKDVTDDAIFKTNGIYALYQEKPISALYFSTSAGITDDWDDIFASDNKTGVHPYLKSKPDYDNQKPLKNEKDVQEFLLSNETGLDIISPKFRWSFEFDRLELEEILHTTLQQQSKVGLVQPKYDGDNKIEGLKEINPIKRTQSGKIIELEIKSETGNYIIKKELGIRRVLKKNNSLLPSSTFFVEAIGKTSLENEKKISFFSSDETYPQTFKIIGGGFGHGVGMSQYGASVLAKKGEKYPDILKHYYSNINIATIPKTVLFNDYNVWYKTEFYFDSETYSRAYLLIDNTKNVDEFPFTINDFQFMETRSVASKELIKINITDYIKNGNNVINFAPLTKNNKGKFITYRVEFL